MRRLAVLPKAHNRSLATKNNSNFVVVQLDPILELFFSVRQMQAYDQLRSLFMARLDPKIGKVAGG